MHIDNAFYILKCRISPKCLVKAMNMMLKLKLQYFGNLM